MITLDVADLVVIASRVLDLDAAEVLTLLDLDAAQAALGAARTAADSGGTLTEAAGVLLHGLVHHHPLDRGSEQVALAALLQFMALNGCRVVLEPPEATQKVIARLIAGDLEPEHLAGWLASRLWLLETTRTRRATRADRRACYNDRARRALALAQVQARALGHHEVGTQHLLLGLIHEGEGVAVTVLATLGISQGQVRERVEGFTVVGDTTPAGPIPFTPRAEKVVALARSEARKLRHDYLGTEHLLLGLVREGKGAAARVLHDLGADPELVHQRVLAVLGAGEPWWFATLRQELSDIRREKEAAFDAGDLERAAALRDQERRLATLNLVDENHRLRHEIERLRALLRQHGIEPDGGASRTA